MGTSNSYYSALPVLMPFTCILAAQLCLTLHIHDTSYRAAAARIAGSLFQHEKSAAVL